MALSSSSFALRRLLRVSSSASLPQWTWSPLSAYRQNSSSSSSSSSSSPLHPSFPSTTTPPPPTFLPLRRPSYSLAGFQG
ncbi:unnamed protein product [Musa acuminata subsp. malaccensis]|uniref:(wild Malaysian banana) hypothetical protein n=1 Tax=Musa acuminata subsp. malaccensis TaxID=214687 RepID=A0A8D7F861_MUSAM|nr:unnamed protein product [Musa acuminata subsp. malaccensis]